MDSSLPRARAVSVARGSWLRRLTLANAAMLVVIVATGATVRLTASGLGCRHWPGCQPGRPLPENGVHSYVEFSNRVVAGLTILVTLATMVAALVSRLPRSAKVVAAAMFVGTLGQAPLGAVTVYYDLNPWLVMSHFALSMLVVALAVWLVLAAWDVRGAAVPDWARAAALAVAVACVALVVTGMLATAAGPHSGDVAIRRLGSFRPAVWLHVRATAVFAIAFVALLVWLWRRRSDHLPFALGVLGVLAVQMAVGEVQYRTKLPWWLVLVHVTLATTVWAVTVAFVGRLWRSTRMAR